MQLNPGATKWSPTRLLHANDAVVLAESQEQLGRLVRLVALACVAGVHVRPRVWFLKDMDGGGCVMSVLLERD